MAKIFPFKGVRPVPDKATKVAALPYDVVNSSEARALAAGNPFSFFHVSKPEIDLPEETDPYSPAVYQKGKESLQQMMEQGVLVSDTKPLLYLYRQKMGENVQTGLVACCSVDDYLNDVIKKHELTRADKEEDRTRHVDVLGANTGPVFLTYRASGSIDDRVAQAAAKAPGVDFVSDDGVGHTFWLVENPVEIQALVDHFGAIDVLYVADGHHRSASAARAGKRRQERNPQHTGDEEYNRFLAVLFPHDQLNIMPYNRVVKDLHGLSRGAFLQAVGESFDLWEGANPEPDRPNHFAMYLDGAWFGLRAKEGTFNLEDPVDRLDCSILQTNLLAPILGIQDPRRDNRIDFIGGIRGTRELERRVDGGEMAVAFSLFPVTVDQLMEVADAGRIMPPKSTWFEPKLRSGLVIHLL